MKFCSTCSEQVQLTIPEDDNRERFVCISCQEIHYQNPNNVTGMLVTHNEDYVLLCKRAIEPRYGFWTLPAGYMENGEGTQEAAARETLEEALACTKNASLYQLFSIPSMNQVHIYYRAELDGDYGAGIESLDVKLVHRDDIPWEELAFTTVKALLERWVESPQDFSVKDATIIRSSVSS